MRGIKRGCPQDDSRRASFAFFFRGICFCELDDFFALDAEEHDVDAVLRRCLTKSSLMTGFLFPLVVGTDFACRSTIVNSRGCSIVLGNVFPWNRASEFSSLQKPFWILNLKDAF
jgi:hypothetical protein